jgi:hypothetical protein
MSLVGCMNDKHGISVSDWHSKHSKAARITSALEEGERTRAELLSAAGGSVQGLQAVLQKLVLEGRVARVRPGVYALVRQP